MKSVVVTGGAGFIGRALVKRCLDSGQSVTVIDNLRAGRRDNLSEFEGRITFREADILDEPSLREIMNDARPDVVVHMAAHHFIPFCNEHPRETLRTNVEGSYTVLEAAARAGASVAVVASSGALYPSLTEPLSETLPPVPPDVYGLSKLLMEEIVEHVARTTELACVVARLFNTFGPYETNPHLIPDIISGLRDGPSLTLGNLDTRRDYVFVDDVAEAIHRLAEVHEDGFACVNVGTGLEHSARDIVSVISELLGREIQIEVDPARLRPVDKPHQRADVHRLVELTGFRPRHSLRDGLRILLTHEGFGEA